MEYKNDEMLKLLSETFWNLERNFGKTILDHHFKPNELRSVWVFQMNKTDTLIIERLNEINKIMNNTKNNNNVEEMRNQQMISTYKKCKKRVELCESEKKKQKVSEGKN